MQSEHLSINQALDDVALIKRVLSETRRGFCADSAAFFMLFGLLALVSPLYSVFSALVPTFMTIGTIGGTIAALALIGRALSAGVFIAEVTLYFCYRRRFKRSHNMLSLRLIDTWAFVLLLCEVFAELVVWIVQTRYAADSGQVLRLLLSLPALFSALSVALAFFFTAQLTEIRSLRWISLLYVLISLVLFALNWTIELSLNGGNSSMSMNIGEILMSVVNAAVLVLLGILLRRIGKNQVDAPCM